MMMYWILDDIVFLLMFKKINSLPIVTPLQYTIMAYQMYYEVFEYVMYIILDYINDCDVIYFTIVTMVVNLI